MEILIGVAIGVGASVLYSLLVGLLDELLYRVRKYDVKLDKFIRREKHKHNRDVIQEIAFSVEQELTNKYDIVLEEKKEVTQ